MDLRIGMAHPGFNFGAGGEGGIMRCRMRKKPWVLKYI